MSAKVRDWLLEKPYTLALSSSFFGFFAHCGVAAAIEEAGLTPQKITGSSAGALVGGALSSGMTAHRLRDLLFSIQRKDFWDPKLGFGFLRGQLFHELIEKHYVARFDDAVIPLEVAAFSLKRMKTVFLGSGSLPSAVVASCAVPLMFHPVKHEGDVYLDGGMFNKSAINPQDKRVLCIFFETRGWLGTYERKISFGTLGPEHKLLHFAGLPSVNVHTLAGGREAYAQGYSRTRAALDRAIGDVLTEA